MNYFFGLMSVIGWVWALIALGGLTLVVWRRGKVTAGGRMGAKGVGDVAE